MIEFLKSDSVFSKIIIALFSAILTITINKLIDWYKERNRLKVIKISIIGFIEENILNTLKATNIDYFNLKENLKNGKILDVLTINDYPWLNSKVFDYFTKSDVLKVLNKIDYRQSATLYQHLIAIDFLQQNSPLIMFCECQDFINEHFIQNKVSDKERTLHYFSCVALINKKNSTISNTDLRIKQCEDLIIFFGDLKNKLKN